MLGYYRLYLLAAPDGKFAGFQETEAAGDLQAVRLAEAQAGPNRLELWQAQVKSKRK